MLFDDVDRHVPLATIAQRLTEEEGDEAAGGAPGPVDSFYGDMAAAAVATLPAITCVLLESFLMRVTASATRAE